MGTCLYSYFRYVIPMNWYLATKLRHGTTNWDEMKQSFLLTFKFEDGFECIDGVRQEIKTTIFRTSVEPITWMQLDWSA